MLTGGQRNRLNTGRRQAENAPPTFADAIVHGSNDRRRTQDPAEIRRHRIASSLMSRDNGGQRRGGRERPYPRQGRSADAARLRQGSRLRSFRLHCLRRERAQRAVSSSPPAIWGTTAAVKLGRTLRRQTRTPASTCMQSGTYTARRTTGAGVVWQSRRPNDWGDQDPAASNLTGASETNLLGEEARRAARPSPSSSLASSTKTSRSSTTASGQRLERRRPYVGVEDSTLSTLKGKDLTRESRPASAGLVGSADGQTDSPSTSTTSATNEGTLTPAPLPFSPRASDGRGEFDVK